ncbi:MAG TPA: (Fe-S)-binding protein [Acidimicrobiia bacterium]|jgi:L-lactate dehydrogenase complex protein LldE
MRVHFMPTCLVDVLTPHVGEAAVDVLESAGCEVVVPAGQTCCGQPAMNVGMVEEARQMAERTIEVFSGSDDPVVLPSGSCAEMLTHHYPRLFAGTEHEEAATRLAGRTRELTRFLVTDLDAPVRATSEGTVAYQYSCHGLRGLGLAGCADRLLEDVERADFDGMECCGFGGLFSVAMPDVSAAILEAKLDRLEASGADVLASGDVSCLMHLEGGLRRRGSAIEVRHIAELLAPEDDE